jgi:hypothetical protein
MIACHAFFPAVQHGPSVARSQQNELVNENGIQRFIGKS